MNRNNRKFAWLFAAAIVLSNPASASPTEPMLFKLTVTKGNASVVDQQLMVDVGRPAEVLTTTDHHFITSCSADKLVTDKVTTGLSYSLSRRLASSTKVDLDWNSIEMIGKTRVERGGCRIDLPQLTDQDLRYSVDLKVGEEVALDGPGTFRFALARIK
jgi:hypothetical protein